VEGRCRDSCSGVMCEERLRLSVVLQVITTGRCMPHQLVRLLVTKHLLHEPKYSSHETVPLHEETYSSPMITHVFKHV